MIKELEDYSWFPPLLRRYQMDYIGSLVSWLGVYRPLIPVAAQMVNVNDPVIVQDLCSGSGIPAIYMQHQVKLILKTLLSDKYPVIAFANSEELEYIKLPVDVLALIPQHRICYTMYNGFHHFSPGDQAALIKKMVEGRNGFLFAEILEPRIFTMIKILLTATLLQVFTAPFIKPFSLKRLFFTYIIPVNLFTVLYDGIISVIRSGSVNQYRKLFEELSSDDFEVAVGRFNNWKGPVIYIKGNPLPR